MKLKLGQVRLLVVVLAVLGLLLLPIGGAMKSGAVTYAGLIFCALSGAASFFLYRCPHCKKLIGPSTGVRCPHCGKKL